MFASHKDPLIDGQQISRAVMDDIDMPEKSGDKLGRCHIPLGMQA